MGKVISAEVNQETGSRFLKGQDVESVTGKSLGKALPMVWTNSAYSQGRLQISCRHIGLGPGHRCLGWQRQVA